MMTNPFSGKAGADLCLPEHGLPGLFEEHPFPILVFDAATLRFLAVNAAATLKYGFTQQEFLEMTAEDIRPAESIDAFRTILLDPQQQTDRANAYTRVEYQQHQDKNGKVFLVDVFAREMHMDGRKVIVVIAVDVTEKGDAKKELHRQMAMSDQLFENSPDAIVQLDSNDRIVRCNPSFTRLFGWETREARGRNINTLIAPPEQRQAAQELSSAVLSRLVIEEEAIRQKRNGEQVVVSIIGYPVYFHDEVAGIYGVYRDITETKRISEKLAYYATHDDLTGLVNRREIAIICNHALHETGNACLLYIDLDQFKLVNDTSGHIAGDQLLCKVARRLRELMRESDSIARLGGDEFAVLLRGCRLQEAEKVAQKIIDELHDLNFSWDNRNYQVSASVGICETSAEVSSFQELLAHADEACYIAKESGRNRYHAYSATDDEIRRRHGHMSWAVRIPDALQNDRFELFVQKITPLCETRENAPPGFEVLLRYRNDDGSLLPPGEFLSAAERYDLIDRIDRWVVRKTLQKMRSCATASEISINLSGLSIGSRAFPDFINQEILDANIDPARLCFEITETAAVQNLEAAVEFIKAMHVIGAKVALDDFGSGMSSFAYMKRLPVNRLKIDGQFIRDISRSKMDRGITRSIVDVSRLFGIETVAEFVETADALKILKEIGVDHAQGFYLHRPEPWS